MIELFCAFYCLNLALFLAFDRCACATGSLSVSERLPDRISHLNFLFIIIGDIKYRFCLNVELNGYKKNSQFFKVSVCKYILLMHWQARPTLKLPHQLTKTPPS